MNTNKYGTTIEHIRQDEVNDVFKATYQGMEVFYTFPRSMEMKAEDVHDFVKPEHFITGIAVTERSRKCARSFLVLFVVSSFLKVLAHRFGSGQVIW